MMEIPFRKDINGLRGVAVALAVLFHFEFTGFSGGFIAVDIFFVMSGFLITGIIETKLEKNEFSLSDFYLRRVRRLLPVYYIFLFIVLILGAIFFYSLLIENLVNSTLYSMFGLSNYHYMKINHQLGYFIFLVMENPLIHTWSISIEFQFYLIWPLLLMLALLLKVPPIWIFIFLFCSFLGISEFSIAEQGGNAYFMTLARVHEFFIGAIAWSIEKKKWLKKHDVFGYMGWILVVISLFVLT